MFNPVKIEDIPAKEVETVFQLDVKEFMKSDYDVAEIDIESVDKDPYHAQQSYRAAARKFGCRVISRRGRLFLVKEGVEC